MNLKIDIDLNKYKPQKSDLKLLKDPSVIFAIVFVAGLIFIGPIILFTTMIIDWLTDDAYAPTARHRSARSDGWSYHGPYGNWRPRGR